MENRRRELKTAYKNSLLPMGVYQLKDSVNGRIFVGGSLNLPGRQNSHLFQLKLNCHPNKELQDDWNAHGGDAFTFEVLETLKADTLPREEWRPAVAALEAKWLARLRPYGDKGYNKEKASTGKMKPAE